MKLKVTHIEKRKYVLSTKLDYEILEKCEQLEKLNLDNNDKAFVKFARTQLERDWRTPLLKKLNVVLRKYENGKDSATED